MRRSGLFLPYCTHFNSANQKNIFLAVTRATREAIKKNELWGLEWVYARQPRHFWLRRSDRVLRLLDQRVIAGRDSRVKECLP